LLARRYIIYFLYLKEVRGSLIECSEHGIFLSTKVSSPMVAGVIRPRIIIPVELYKSLSREELLLIIAHERNHIARMDNLMNHVIQVTKDLFFFILPLPYLIKKCFLEREKICDRLATGHTFEKALQLSKAMLKVAESRLPVEKGLFARIIPAGNLYFVKESEVFSRVKDILSFPGEKQGIFGNKYAYMLLALVIFKILIGASFFASSGLAETYGTLAMQIIVSA
jgi:hypothetical protein